MEGVLRPVRENPVLVSMVEVAPSTGLLPVGRRSGPADEDGEGALAAVAEETVAALVRSRVWCFAHRLGKRGFVDHLVCFLLMGFLV